MTAEELIERLKVLPAETPVLVEGYETGYDDIAGLKPLKVTRYRNAQDWDGEYQASGKFSDTENSALSAVLIFGRRGHLRKVQTPNVTTVKAMEELDTGQGQRFSLDELVAQCDPDAPMPEELRDWENAEPCALWSRVMKAGSICDYIFAARASTSGWPENHFRIFSDKYRLSKLTISLPLIASARLIATIRSSISSVTTSSPARRVAISASISSGVG